MKNMNYGIFLISLGLTVLAYGAFPLIYARNRKMTITKKKYVTLCYGINFLVMALFIATNGKSSGAPYLLWTWVFSKSGLKTLENKGLLEDYQRNYLEDIPNRLVECKHCGYRSKDYFEVCPQCGKYAKQGVSAEQPDKPAKKICFCRKCGEPLKDGSRFCYKCGTEIYFDNKVQ